MPIIYEPKGRALEYSLLALNHYRGCAHGCDYCYVPAATHNPEFHTKIRVRDRLLGLLEKEAMKYAADARRVLLSFSCDPYQPLDLTTQTTRRVLKILSAFDIPFHILTKGGLQVRRDFDLYGEDDQFAVTLTFWKAKDSLKHEPYAAVPDERIGALKAAKAHGIKTWVSLEPVIDMEQSLELIRRTHDYVDLYKIGTVNHVRSSYNTEGWARFGKAAIHLCRQYSTDFFIKHDLAKHLAGFEYTNTDNRLVTH